MNLNGGATMIRETEKRLLPGAACAVLFVILVGATLRAGALVFSLR